MQSESIAALAAALSKAQGAIKGASKDTANPFFKSKYADLASVWDACRDALSANGLSVIQTTDDGAEGVTVITTLAHSSGEWVRGKLTMKPAKNDPQGVGSAITYARRYALAAMVGVAPEDDDGNAASGKGSTPVATPAPTPIATPAPTPIKADGYLDGAKRKTTSKATGPLTITELKSAMRAFSHDMEGCTEIGELDALLAASREILDQCEVDLKDWYYGTGDAKGAQQRVAERIEELTRDPSHYLKAG
jgi:hypothetical protein